MMKKSIFAVAVASALTLGAAQAETVLYGSIRYDYQNAKQGVTFDDYPTSNGDRYFVETVRNNSLNDVGSRLGFKGSEDLGNGNSVVYQLEWGFDGMEQGNTASGFKNRLAWMGVTGGWGTVAAGRQDNPFKVTVVDDSIVDDFNSVGTAATQRAMTTNLTGAGFGGVHDIIEDVNGIQTKTGEEFRFTTNQASFSRVGKSIAYVSPDFAGFSFNAALILDEDLYGVNDTKGIDLWTVNAQYAYDLGVSGTLLAKAGYIQGKLADTNSSKMWGLLLGYKQDAFGVTAAYADGNHKAKAIGATKNGPKEKSKGWDVGASFSFGPNYFSTVRATYGQNDLKIDGDKDKVKSWAVGFEQKLSTRTRAWVEYGQEKTSFAQENVDKLKENTISIGMRHDF